MLDRTHASQHSTPRGFVTVCMGRDGKANFASFIHNGSQFFIGKGALPRISVCSAGALASQDLDKINVPRGQGLYDCPQVFSSL